MYLIGIALVLILSSRKTTKTIDGKAVIANTIFQPLGAGVPIPSNPTVRESRPVGWKGVRSRI